MLTAKELQAKIAAAQAAEASEAMKHLHVEKAGKAALMERLGKPSGLTDREVMDKASAIIGRAVENGLLSVQVFRFPNHLYTDSGCRAATTSATRSSTIPAACRAMSSSPSAGADQRKLSARSR